MIEADIQRFFIQSAPPEDVAIGLRALSGERQPDAYELAHEMRRYLGIRVKTIAPTHRHIPGLQQLVKQLNKLDGTHRMRGVTYFGDTHLARLVIDTDADQFVGYMLLPR